MELVVFGEAPIPSQPREGALYDPAVGQHLETLGLLGLGDDLRYPLAGLFGPLHKLTRITLICPDQVHPGQQALDFAQYQSGTIPVLDVGRMHYYHPHQPDQPERVYEQVPLATLDLLARVIAAIPPFSVVFTDWLSRIAAEGVRFLPACLRTRSRSLELMISSVPSSRQRPR